MKKLMLSGLLSALVILPFTAKAETENPARTVYNDGQTIVMSRAAIVNPKTQKIEHVDKSMVPSHFSLDCGPGNFLVGSCLDMWFICGSCPNNDCGGKARSVVGTIQEDGSVTCTWSFWGANGK